VTHSNITPFAPRAQIARAGFRTVDPKCHFHWHVDKGDCWRENQKSRIAMEAPFKPGQTVRVNLAGMQVDQVTFHAAVTDAIGNIVRQTSEDPPKYLVKLLFSFRGINQVEVPADRVRAA
jgi:hypothetical protein